MYRCGKVHHPFGSVMIRRCLTSSTTLNAKPAASQKQRTTQPAERYENENETQQQQRDGQRVLSGSPQAQITRMPNQFTIASVENNSPITRIAVALKAGPRYEPAVFPGISHVMRNAASLATKHCSSFALTRTLEQLGCNLSVTSTREQLVYLLEGPRNNVEQTMPFFASIIMEPQLRTWEVSDARARLISEIAEYKAQPELIAVELLHDAAYRGSLRNSIYAHKFAVAGINGSMLKEYYANVIQPNRMAIGALGIDQHALLTLVTNHFGDLTTKSSSSSDGDELSSSAEGNNKKSSRKNTEVDVSGQKARYAGGQRRQESSDYIAYAIIASEGASYTNLKEYLSAAALQQYLGSCPAVKWPSERYSRLAKVAAGATRNPFAVSAFNTSYSDSGLFGYSVATAARDAGPVVRACFQQMKQIADGGVPDKNFDELKDAVKLKLASKFTDCPSTYARSIAIQALETGDVLTPDALVAEVDSLSAGDVKAFSAKLKKTALSMSATGNLSYAPFIEDISRS